MVVSILWYLGHKYLWWNTLVSAALLSEHTYVEILLVQLHFICIAWHFDEPPVLIASRSDERAKNSNGGKKIKTPYT